MMTTRSRVVTRAVDGVARWWIALVVAVANLAGCSMITPSVKLGILEIGNGHATWGRGETRTLDTGESSLVESVAKVRGVELLRALPTEAISVLTQAMPVSAPYTEEGWLAMLADRHPELLRAAAEIAASRQK